jgi:antitoxin (DNA-binding transcriptional repressor) of toxin-antitoxin stability system
MDMGQDVFMTKSVSMATAKASLSELASRSAAGERFALLRRGKPVAALVSPTDLAVLEATARTATFLQALESFRRRHRRSLPVAPLDVPRTLGRRV